MTRLSVHHLAFRTHDLAGLVRFYREVLGLEVAREQAGRSVWLGLEGAVLMIEVAEAGEPRVRPDTLELVALRVDEAGRRAVRDRLAARAVPLDGETEHTTYFRDPEGRRVAVSTHPL